MRKLYQVAAATDRPAGRAQPFAAGGASAMRRVWCACRAPRIASVPDAPVVVQGAGRVWWDRRFRGRERRAGTRHSFQNGSSLLGMWKRSSSTMAPDW